MHAEGTFLPKSLRPRESRISKAPIQDKELALLVQCCTRLYERARRIPCFHNNRRLGQGRHGHIPFWEEKSISKRCLPRVADDGDLTDDQELTSDPLLQRGVRWRVGRPKRRAEYRNCA